MSERVLSDDPGVFLSPLCSDSESWSSLERERGSGPIIRNKKQIKT